MIEVTNNKKDFFENNNDELWIYGAGNAGYWIGYYLDRCKISFCGYLDKNVTRENVFLNKKQVCSPLVLSKNKNKPVRIIVSPKTYESVLTDLLWADHNYGITALCLIPLYYHVSLQEEGYHINKLLAYFRRKLLVKEFPTIISNNCVAGFVYDMFDMMLTSPTINTYIKPTDYIKLCNNPHKYLTGNISQIRWQRLFGNPRPAEDVPCGEVEDITIFFGHTNESTDLEKRWRLLCSKINWNRLVYILCSDASYLEPISIKVEHSFLNQKNEHLMFVIKNAPIYGDITNNKIYLQENYFAIRDSAIENYFDLLGWINQDYKDT